jgi:hypothetical protein
MVFSRLQEATSDDGVEFDEQEEIQEEQEQAQCEAPATAY